MPRDFPIRIDLAKLGLPERTIRVLEKAALIVDAIERITGTETDLDTVNDQIDQIDEDLEDAALSLISLDVRLDDLEDDAPYVSQDVGAAWAAATGTASRATFATFAGQTITNPPTQAEVEAIDDHVVILSQRLKALIDDLKANGALT